MRAVIQRVNQASVMINGKCFSTIQKGLLVFLGIAVQDTLNDAYYLAKKIANLRIFSDEYGHMNLSVQDSKAEILVVSQFTLHAQTRKGNRPSFIIAARPEQALPLYDEFIATIRELSDCPVHTGKFGADMKVCLENDGPVTIFIDSQDAIAPSITT